MNTTAAQQQTQPATAQQTQSRLIPLQKWNDIHAWPPIGGLQHLRFNCKTNGFAAAFKKVGRRVLIDERAFFAAVDAQNQGGK
jgi:hypothetical protein